MVIILLLLSLKKKIIIGLTNSHVFIQIIGSFYFKGITEVQCWKVPSNM